MTPPDIGGVVLFGKYSWRVLDVQGSRALLLADRATHTGIPYNEEWQDVTWETCSLRKWLNSGFLSQAFTPREQAKIAQTTLLNENNPWYNTNGGSSTCDKIFLLSLSESAEYFGDSGQLNSRPGKNSRYIADEYDSARIAANADGAPVWWWLRSPGVRRHAASVCADGCIAIGGHRVDDGHAPGGIRPALFLNF